MMWGKNVSRLLDFLYPGCFFLLRAHQQHCCYVARPLLFGIWESIRAVTGGASLNGCPGHRAIRGSEWAAASGAGEAATLLFSSWPVLQNIVCTSVILRTPWAQRRPPTPSTFSFFFSLSPPSPPCSHLISALVSIFFLSLSLRRSHFHVNPFFSYTKI